MHGQSGADPTPPAGVVELREDVPLAGGGGGGGGGARCAGGPRLISGCFAVLSVSITVALLTQMYYGEYEVVPHGSVSSSAAECSRAGTDALKAGGRALDAAVAAALCLAVVAPHRTSLDASGSMLYWEYRRGRGRGPGGSQLVELAEWGAPGGGTGVPRLVAALATLHARLGALSWARVVQPAVQLARTGYNVSEGLASALAARADAVPVGSLRTAPLLALYLATLQRNTSAELASAWGGAGALRVQSAAVARAGRWRVWAGGAGGGLVAGALAAALHPAPPDAAAARDRAVTALQAAAKARPGPPGASPAGSPSWTGSTRTLRSSPECRSRSARGRIPRRVEGGRGRSAARPRACDTRRGTSLWSVWSKRRFGVVALVGAGGVGAVRLRVLVFAPAGTRFVVGGESIGAAVQAASALATEGAPAAVERARVPVWGATGGAAVNVVRQRGDALASHADSRGGGHASRY